ncbi:MAG: discoidin domain-containing protein [Anaerolineales bacterium]
MTKVFNWPVAFHLALLIILATGCAAQPDPTSTQPRTTFAEDEETGSQPTTLELPPLPNLTRQPLYWFGPLPPMPTGAGRPFIGSEDFMNLFETDAPWQQAASNLHVFKLYGEWVAYHATGAQLRQAVEDIRRRGLALAVEAGPLNATEECGQGIEGFAGHDEGRLVANRILEAGGNIDLIALDEPYYFGHFYQGPNACNYPAEQIAAEVHEYIELMRTFFPDVIVGDTEPMPAPIRPEDYTQWLLTYLGVNSEDLDFLHIDVDWSRTDWAEMVKHIEDFGAEIGVPIGIIYNGNWGDPTDEIWISISGERVKRYELELGAHPAHVLFQSWNDHPDFVLPETEPFTYTGFLAQYFSDKSALGYRTEGFLANLAFNKPTRVSRFLPGNEGQWAVDGDFGTLWSSGDFPTQWIEIDLGEPYDIAEIRLVPSQFPDGDTRHNVYGRGPGTGDSYVVLYTFQGPTQDSQYLTFRLDDPFAGIRYIRIETTSSPSWVAWREIEVLSAGE